MENVWSINEELARKASADSNGFLPANIAQDLWSRCAQSLKDSMDPQIYAAFVEPLRIVSFNLDESEVKLVSPSRLIRDRVLEGFKDKIIAVLCSMLDLSALSLVVNVDEDAQPSPKANKPYVIVKKPKVLPPAKSSNTDRAALIPIGQNGVNPKYTFSNFVVGNNNQFCHAAALRVSEEPGKSYNPLFIYGGVGLGKTHLLHAIGNAVLAKNPAARVLYISSESFTNELIQSLRVAKMDEFKNKYRSIEVLLIDDIQFMCGKERTQEEFFHTFNALHQAKHQIVITSDKVPQDIPGLEERLQTRFSWGLTADLQAPDFETRVAILKRKASLDGFELPEDVTNLMAEKISSNIRELEGALTRVHAISSLQNQAISLELATSAIKPLLQPKLVRIAVSDIKRIVAEHFGIKVSDMISKRRTKNLSFPRHIGMYLCRKHTTCSYPEIGGHFGGRDHSSVIHAANVVAHKIETDLSVRALVAEVEKKLLANAA